jgi:uncharacterized membrane protein (UPF0182 family)
MKSARKGSGGLVSGVIETGGGGTIMSFYDKGPFEWIDGLGENEPEAGEKRPRDGGNEERGPRFRRSWIVAAVLAAAFLFGFPSLAVVWTDLLWFQSQGLGSVFWGRFFPQWGLFLATAAATFLILYGNWRFILGREAGLDGRGRSTAGRAAMGFALVFAVLSGLGARSSWTTVLSFLHSVPFGRTDPLFGRDVSFFVFGLPFWRFLQGWLSGVVGMALVGSAVLYGATGALRFEGLRPDVRVSARVHLALLGGFWVALWGVGTLLDRYDLVYASRGAVYGAGFADLHVTLPALLILGFAALLAAGLLLTNAVRPMWKLSIVACGLLFAFGLLLKGFVPGLVQQYVVKPNELELERPYLERNMKASLEAFGLDRVNALDFTPEADISPAELKRERDVLKNVRLWDYGPLLRTFKQLQEIRSYYDFRDVDIDRYAFEPGPLRQVMLSVRELDPEQLQNPTWVNTHLEFTHGYGAVMNPVNEVAPGGLPVLFIKDLPPRFSVPLSLDRPQVYYGESLPTYALVGTDVKEFDYPMGAANARTSYSGKGGVRISGLLRRLAFTLRFRDTEILLTGALKPESRILYERRLGDALEKVAPFLVFDSDPYPVLAKGRIWWINDAYTVSDRYPYARPLSSNDPGLQRYGGINYIRNSVKAVVDAYDGTLTLYVADGSDPLVRVWSAIFPALFKPVSAMPPELRSHLRYPEELFEVQTEIFRVFHMKDVNTYYNREDVWEVTPPGREKPIPPNYVTLRVEGGKEPEFALIRPFMPAGRSNLIGWMAARCDGKHLGELMVYAFPKQKLIYGPAQIEALIDQNPEISAQLSLWSQRGSDVIRGDLLVIPLGKSLLYVQPLYLKANKGELPELKRVILSAGGRIAWDETFSGALAKLFGAEAAGAAQSAPAAPGRPAEAKPEPILRDAAGAVGSDDLRGLTGEATKRYEAAVDAQRRGDWARYGEELKALESALRRLEEATGKR